jgi:hypothetical protein
MVQSLNAAIANATMHSPWRPVYITSSTVLNLSQPGVNHIYVFASLLYVDSVHWAFVGLEQEVSHWNGCRILCSRQNQKDNGDHLQDQADKKYNPECLVLSSNILKRNFSQK